MGILIAYYFYKCFDAAFDMNWNLDSYSVSSMSCNRKLDLQRRICWLHPIFIISLLNNIPGLKLLHWLFLTLHRFLKFFSFDILHHIILANKKSLTVLSSSTVYIKHVFGSWNISERVGEGKFQFKKLLVEFLESKLSSKSINWTRNTIFKTKLLTDYNISGTSSSSSSA